MSASAFCMTRLTRSLDWLRWRRSPSRAACRRPRPCRSRSSPTAPAPRSSATARRSSTTGRSRATGRCASGSRSGTASQPSRCSSRTGRCRASRCSPGCSSTRARACSSRAPTYDRAAAHHRPARGRAGARSPMDDEGLDPDALELDAAPRSSTRSRPSRTRAAARSRSSAAAASPSSPRDGKLLIARGRPVLARPLRGRAAAEHLRARRRRGRRLLVLLLEDRRARACASATWSARPTLIARLEELAVQTYLTPGAAAAGDRATSSSAAGCSSRTSQRVIGAARARDATRCSTRSSRRCPRARRWSRPEGGYFIWLDFPEAPTPPTCSRAASEQGVTFVAGARLLPARPAAASAPRGSPSASSRPTRSSEESARLAGCLRELRASPVAV